MCDPVTSVDCRAQVAGAWKEGRWLWRAMGEEMKIRMGGSSCIATFAKYKFPSVHALQYKRGAHHYF
eukprot:3644806-Rhodomonas_salina.1